MEELTSGDSDPYGNSDPDPHGDTDPYGDIDPYGDTHLVGYVQFQWSFLTLWPQLQLLKEVYRHSHLRVDHYPGTAIDSRDMYVSLLSMVPLTRMGLALSVRPNSTSLFLTPSHSTTAARSNRRPA